MLQMPSRPSKPNNVTPLARGVTPERRRRGRPRKPSVTRTVKLDPAIDDAVCRIALRTNQSVHAVMLIAVRKMVEANKRISGINENPTDPNLS